MPQRLPVTLPDLVAAAPSLTDDGSVILGERRSTVYLLDAATGRLLQALSNSKTSTLDEAVGALTAAAWHGVQLNAPRRTA